jgi:hypothetical protein
MVRAQSPRIVYFDGKLYPNLSRTCWRSKFMRSSARGSPAACPFTCAFHANVRFHFYPHVSGSCPDGAPDHFVDGDFTHCAEATVDDRSADCFYLVLRLLWLSRAGHDVEKWV